MSDPNAYPNYDPGDRGSRAWRFLAGGGMALLLACSGYLLWRVNALGKEAKATAEWRASMLTEISELRESLAANSTTSYRRLQSLGEQLEAAKHQAARSAGQARIDAQKHAEQLADKIAQEQARQQQQVANELTEVKTAATTTNTKITDVSNEVAATRSELTNTIADLKRVTGDMGVMSGLIATNSTELSALKQLGDRNYFEFNMKKTSQPQKVGDISMVVKKTDPKRNKFTIEVVADDKKVEKRDKNVNEPVQFYVAKARQPYEIVVNDVKKDQITGYLSTPKVQVARK